MNFKLNVFRDTLPDDAVFVHYSRDVHAYGGRDLKQRGMYVSESVVTEDAVNLFAVNPKGDRISAASLQIPRENIPALIAALEKFK